MVLLVRSSTKEEVRMRVDSTVLPPRGKCQRHRALTEKDGNGPKEKAGGSTARKQQRPGQWDIRPRVDSRGH